MTELDLIKEDVEKYFAETESQNYKLVKDLHDQPLFTFDTLLKFTAMYRYSRANEAEKNNSIYDCDKCMNYPCSLQVFCGNMNKKLRKNECGDKVVKKLL